MVDGEEMEISHNYGLSTSWEGDTSIPNEESLNVILTKTYTIVGIVERSFYEAFSAAGYMVFSFHTSSHSLNNIYLEYKHPSKSYQYTEEMVSNLGLEDLSYNYNDSLLYFYGVSKYDNINNTYLPLILIALTVISIGCIIVIYNSFAISTMERKKSFGLYSSIGATSKQILKTVLFEAFVVGIIGILLGIIGAFLGIYIVVLILNHLLGSFIDLHFVFHVNLLYLIIPLFFMVIVIFISAYLPAKRSSKITPIEAIRGNDDIKISKKEVRTPKFIRALFGIEGDLAFKNIKRNKKKYRITVISLFISIVMFNTFTSYLGYVTKASDAVDYYDYDIGIDLQGDLGTVEEDMDQILRNYDIDDALEIMDYGALRVTNLSESDFTLEYRNLGYQDIQEDNGLVFNYYVLSDDDYKEITDSEALLINSKYFTIYTDSSRTVRDVEIFQDSSYNLQFLADGQTLFLDAEVMNQDIKGLKNTLYTPVPILLISLSTYQDNFQNTDECYARLVLFTDEYQQINQDI